MPPTGHRLPPWLPAHRADLATLAAIVAGVVGIVVLVNSGWPLPALGMGSRWVSNLPVYLWHMPIVVVVFGLYILAPGRFGASASLTSERGDPVACPAPIGWHGRKDAS